jgi:hypothetical protein
MQNMSEVRILQPLERLLRNDESPTSSIGQLTTPISAERRIQKLRPTWRRRDPPGARDVQIDSLSCRPAASSIRPSVMN